jgi:Bacterial Ig domain
MQVQLPDSSGFLRLFPNRHRPRTSLAVALLFRFLNRHRLRTGLAVALLFGVVAAASVSTQRPAAATLGSPLTAAYFDSEPGEPLLNGGSITFDSVLYQGGAGAPRFTLFDNAANNDYQIYFAPPTSQTALAAGVYENAQFSPDATHPQLFIDRGGLDVCPSGTGRFVVDDLTFAPGGDMQSFSVRFEEHCNSGDPALFGEISYNSTADYRTRSVNPSSLTLLSTGGGPTTGTITVTDNGPSNLTPTGFNIAGADASQFSITGNTCSAPIASTQSCKVTVNYTPSATPSQGAANLTYYDELSPAGSPGEPATAGTGRDIPLTGDSYFTRVLVPSDGAVLAGVPYLDAAAGDAAGVTNVAFELSGNGLSDKVIATATPTLFGWVAKWNTTSVPNGTYSLQSVATDAANNSYTSEPITVTVNNQPPATSLLIPAGDVSVSGTNALLDASASSPLGIASVSFEVSGGTLVHHVVATATPTIYGYVAQWNTTAVPNGNYALQSFATDGQGNSAGSVSIEVAVANAPPNTAVVIPSTGTTQSGTTALLDASASSSPDVTTVTFELTGGTITNQVIATATPTIYGYLAQWNTTAVPNGIYSLASVASYAGGVSGSSTPITITVSN